MAASDNRNSLLAHLAYEFTNQTELVATKALAYILGRSGAARDALRELLRIGCADVGPIVSVETESTGDDTGRVDLALRNDAGEERVLIEAKFWAGLTGNQPAAYLERLPNDGKPSVLLFVAPEMRLGTLWPLIRARAEDAGFALGDVSKTGNLRATPIIGGKRRLMLSGWSALLGAMASRADVAGDTLAGEDLRQLEALCARQDLDAFLPLRSEGLGPEFARLMQHLIRLVDAAFRRGKSDGFIQADGRRTSSDVNGHGRRITIGGAYAWFGISYSEWALKRETPVWLILWNLEGVPREDPSRYTNWRTVRARLQPVLEDKRFEILAYDHCLEVPIYLPEGVERDAVLDSVVKRLRDVAELISPPKGIPRGRPRKQKKG